MPSSRGPNRPGPGRPRPGAGRSGTGRSGAARPGPRGSARSRHGSADLGRAVGSASPTSPTTPSPADSVVDPAAAGTNAGRNRTRGAGSRRTAGLTTRAIALAVVLLILTISYASSLRVYLNQRQDIAETQQQIIRSQQRIGQLSDEISRWNDPNYVKTQARIRLGWVMPGETGYRVIGPDGKTVSGDAEIGSGQTTTKPKKVWYDKLWGSVEAADKPRPVTGRSSAEDQPPITPTTKPSSSSSPSSRPSASPSR